MHKIIITVDGYSSCGKSTLAKQLAQTLNYVFIDSGAMYRAITLYFLRNNIDSNNTECINSALQNIQLRFKYNTHEGISDMYLNDENVESAIRDLHISNNVSLVSAIKEVREFAVAQQQEMGREKGIVMDGRDIGTTVFPNAELKIFVTADINVRVQRRFLEMSAKNPDVTLEEVQHNLETRDRIDSTREVSPLRKADDAVVLDNSLLSREEQLAIALEWANNTISK